MLYFMRHAETALNEEKRLRGWKDPDVLSDALIKAEQTARWIKHNGGADIIFTSDFKRTRETAKAAGKILGCTIQETPYLRPIDFGELNGSLIETISDNLDAMFLAWEKDPSAQAFGGDSFSSFQDRVSKAMKFLFELARSKKNIIAVTHSRVCLYAMAYFYNLERPLEGERIRTLRLIDTGYCDVIRFSLSDKDKLLLTAVNPVHNGAHG